MRRGRSLFKDQDFLKFWTGQSISVFGAQFSPLAIQTIAVLYLGASNIQLGMLSFLNTVSFLLLGLLVGVWVDRHRRRRIMILANLGRALALFTIPLFALLSTMTMNLLFAVTLTAGVLSVFFEISYQAYLPSLVEKNEVVDANSKLEASRSASFVVGPAAAGAIIAIASAPVAVIADTVGYMSSAVSLMGIKKDEVLPSPTGRSAWSDIREGILVVAREPRLRAIAVTTAIFNLFSSAFGALLVKYFLQDLRMSVPELGVALGVGSLGGILGALISARFTSAVGVGRAIVTGAVVGSVFMTTIYFAVPSDAFLIVVGAEFLTSLGVLLYNIPQVSFRQVLVPKEMQGRMNATMRTIVWGTLPLGGLMGGTVAQVVGLRETIGLMTFLNSLAFLWVLLSPVRHVREFPA